MKILFLMMACWVTQLRAQPSIPIVVGGHLEVGSGETGSGAENGLVRVLPWIAWWSPGLGWLRVGYASHTTHYEDSLQSGEQTMRHIALQGGLSLGGPERPYILTSWSQTRQLADWGDAHWQEWGLGLGSMIPFNPWCGVLLEAEHRWVGERTDPLTETHHSGTRWQLNLGFLVFFY